MVEKSLEFSDFAKRSTEVLKLQGEKSAEVVKASGRKCLNFSHFIAGGGG